MAVQLNDTHPAMSIPELIRLLMADGASFEQAFQVARSTFSYTNHTVMGEALEKWDLNLLGSVVPEIVNIIRMIDERCRREHGHLWIIRDNQAHMANLSVYVSTAVNGVAQIHSEILKRDLFKDWYAVYPERFQNKTNGITPRRWLGLCNPELTKLLESYVNPGFLTNLDWLQAMKPLIDENMVNEFNAVKRVKKEQLCKVIAKREGVELNPDFVFDVQVKRLHEYKRQLMNALSIMDIYLSLKDGSLTDFTPTCFIFGAKSAPGYQRAKAIIRYINQVAKKINNDPDMADKLKVVFVQNYNCSYAEHIIPAADISEQISPAGTEASGTGNMKLMLNGAVTLGTLDGANVEIAQEAGRENEYIFGHTVPEINAMKDSYNPRDIYNANPDLRRALDTLDGANVEIVEQAGMENNYIFGATVQEIEQIKDSYNARWIYDNDERIRRAINTLVDGTVPTDDELRELHNALINGTGWHKADHYYIMKDFHSYVDAKLQANRDYRDRQAFGRKCLMNVASAGKFSADRTIRQYAEEIWHV